MDAVSYLIARGWRRWARSPGSGGDEWYDSLGRAHFDVYDLRRVVEPMAIERAEQVQLDRDAALRDYVDERRPKFDAVSRSNGPGAALRSR